MLKNVSEQETDTFTEVNKVLNKLIDNLNLVESKVLVLDSKKKKPKKGGFVNMKTLILSAVLSLALLISITSAADVSKDTVNFNTMSTTNGIVTVVRDLIDDLNTEIRNAGGRATNIGTGNIYYVDSNVGNTTNVGTRPEWARSTIDSAVALCTANNGDVIVVLQGHAENLSAADGVDVDVAGVAVIGLGDGTDAPELSYTLAAGEFVIGAANVTIYNLRFLAATGSITMAISVEAGGDNHNIVGCIAPEPATVTDEFLDFIDYAAGADGGGIYNNIYRHTSTTGPAHFLEAGNGENSDYRIVGNDIAGEFSVSAIWSNDADSWVHIERNTIANLTAGQHAIEYTAAAEGMIIYNAIHTNASPTSIDPGSMFCIENYVSQAINESGILYPAGP